MQELLKIIVQRLQAIEDAYHAGVERLDRIGSRLADMEERDRVTAAPWEGVIERLEGLERRIATSERLAGDVPAFTARLFVMEERLNAAVQRLDSQPDAGTRIEEIGEVVAGLHSTQQSLKDAIAAAQPGRQLEILDERLSSLEASLGDMRAMADHVIAHEAQITAVEHHTADYAARLGAIEERSSASESQFEILDRQLGAHRTEMNGFEERAAALEQRQAELHEDALAGPARVLHDRVEALEQRLEDLGVPYVALEEKIHESSRAAAERIASLAEQLETTEAGIVPVTEGLAGLGARIDTADARFASLGERIAAVQDLHADVVRQAGEIAALEEGLQAFPTQSLEVILERLAGLDRLAADVASHAGELATLRNRSSDAAPSPIVVAGEHAPEVHAKLDDLTRQVEDLRGSATMLDSIRTLLAASDIEKTFDEINDRVAKLDAQMSTLFTLQRMSADSENKAPVLSLEDD